MTAFDPDAWLEAFTAAGGSYMVDHDGRLWLGALAIGESIRRDAVIKKLKGRLRDHPERVEAIKGVVRERCLIC